MANNRCMRCGGPLLETELWLCSKSHIPWSTGGCFIEWMEWEWNKERVLHSDDAILISIDEWLETVKGPNHE